MKYLMALKELNAGEILSIAALIVVGITIAYNIIT